MKTIHYLSIITITAALFLSCRQIDYQGEYSKDGFYQGSQSVYFYFAKQTDTLKRYSFGTDWVEHKRQIVKVPVRITGLPAKTPLTFKVTVDENASSAKPNQHYTPFSGEFQIKPDYVNGYVEIEVWRDNLSSNEKTPVRLVLNLQNTAQLQAAFPDNRKVVVAIDDYLAEPYYWVYYTYYWGPYSQIKYRKFLEYYNGDPKKLESALTTDFNGVSMNFVKVYQFFKEHPEYNQVLPATLYIPYK